MVFIVKFRCADRNSLLRAINVGDGEGPAGEQIGSGDKLGEQGGQKLPVPAEQVGQNRRHAKVQHVVRRRSGAFDE